METRTMTAAELRGKTLKEILTDFSSDALLEMETE
jgi:hypothetical protein